MLDVRCLEFSNGVLAASALFHFSSLELVESVSGKNHFPHFLFVSAGVTPPRLTTSSFCPCSSEEGGGGGVREVDGAVCDGAARGRQLADEDVPGNLCG